MNVIYHGSENEGSLVVVEQKRKRGVEKPFAVTVANYYAKGPSEHPSLVLLHMFQQVSRTRTWKWMESPHCAAATQRRQRSGVNGKRVETETENDDEERNYLQWLSLIGGTILADQ
ncbi:hypothetical protein A2U01_0043087, partial [Trifolium medium]|nr:hypothetical protein [Trifolium medium]